MYDDEKADHEDGEAHKHLSLDKIKRASALSVVVGNEFVALTIFAFDIVLHDFFALLANSVRYIVS